MRFGRQNTRSIHASGHNLTSLVDCFAIILIYLLFATSFGEVDLEIPKDMQLPKAEKTSALLNSTIIQVRKDGYFIAGQQVPMNELAVTIKNLFETKQKDDKDATKNSIVVQADKDMKFGEINPVVLTSLMAGFEEVQFAVLKGEEGKD